MAYILRSELTGTYYYGHTKDLIKRLRRHNAGKVRSTKARRPWRMHYKETFSTKAGAYRRELYFKSIEGRRHLKSLGII